MLTLILSPQYAEFHELCALFQCIRNSAFRHRRGSFDHCLGWPSTIDVFILFLCIREEIYENLIGVLVRQNRLLIYDALSFEYIALISVESVYAGLHRLLDDKLLNDQVTFAPLFEQVVDKLIFAEVHSYASTAHILLNNLHSILRWNDSITFLLFLTRSFLILVFSAHVLVDELAHLKYRYRLLFDDKLERQRVCVNEPILGVLVLRASNIRCGGYEELHPMLLGDIGDLVNRAVTRDDRARFHFLHLCAIRSIF